MRQIQSMVYSAFGMKAGDLTQLRKWRWARESLFCCLYIKSVSHCGRVNSLFDGSMGVKYFQCFPKNSIGIKCEGTRSYEEARFHYSTSRWTSQWSASQCDLLAQELLSVRRWISKLSGSQSESVMYEKNWMGLYIHIQQKLKNDYDIYVKSYDIMSKLHIWYLYTVK